MDLVRVFLEIPVPDKPGSHFVYNTAATYMLSAIVQKVTGQTVLDYLRQHVRGGRVVHAVGDRPESHGADGAGFPPAAPLRAAWHLRPDMGCQRPGDIARRLWHP